MTERASPRSPVGEIIGKGKLEVLELVGAGSMGEVYKARTTDTGLIVALKILHAHLAENPEFVARFKREIAIARYVKSPFNAGIYSRGTWEATGRPWMAVEWLEGESLQARLNRERALPGVDVGWIVEDVLQGLADAHEARDEKGKLLELVHRDLKPANIFLERVATSMPSARAERARIVDFGISKVAVTMTNESLASVTSTGVVLGTPLYMAPEQGGASPVDARADLYAVGVLIFHMLSGQFPYPGGSLPRLLALKRSYAPRRLSDAMNIAVPEQVEQIVATMMAREPAKRYGSAREALATWRSSLPLLRQVPRVEVPEAATDEGLDTEVDPPPSEFKSQGQP